MARKPTEPTFASPEGPARIEYLKVENYRALRSVELRDITPLSVLLGPNGTGKSTVFDVFNFLSECFQFGLRHAWDRRGRAKELRTRGQSGPVTIEIKYRERPGQPIITYHLAIDEGPKGPSVASECLQWRRGATGKPFRFLDYKYGEGGAISGEMPDDRETRAPKPLRSPDIIAVSTLGQLAEHPRVAALREFIADWYVSYLSIDDTRSQPEAGPQERLSNTGDNLPNVIQYLKEQHPQELDRIFAILTRRVPGQEQPVQPRLSSDGMLKLLAHMTVFHAPNPPQLIAVEEVERFLHPRLLPELAEDFRMAAQRSQILATTQSPLFLNALHPEEVRVLYRDQHGNTRAVRGSEMEGVPEFVSAGASLGDLWMEGHFGVGDPLARSRCPAGSTKAHQ